MEQNKQLSDLFELARNEAPKKEFSDLKGEFLATIAVGGTGVATAVIAKKSLWAKWLAASFKFKAIIMVTTLSTLTISGIIVATQLTSNPSVVREQTEFQPQEQAEIIEIRSEDGIEKTIVYNEKKEVMNISIDSSTEAKATAQRIKLSTKQPEALKSIHSENRVPIDAQLRIYNKVLAADSLTMKKFLITEISTNEEIQKIQEQAIAAGMEFTFETKVRDKKIKRMTLNMKKDNNKWMSKITGTDSFSFEFGWWEDADGKFVKFLCDEERERICGDC